ncbi:glycosyltransferase family 2 protein [Rhodocytophaga aerolata]|uniref:Glycosyltransferase family 2 protein n=1 Tax=Rhodocytophaga aerolata TaxID=455078 RepID=A0ABT8RCJ1_9BACT|nr:glycosyltransferase family 2 protein [Rhodocytophaga aerolata]MDO1449810.1 glycosyltransferase family 2 protein [Rhodocytophaga aerolata]
MKISIITVAYNSALTIDATIRSVLSQTYNDIEYILIDGNSSDGTQDIIASYGHPSIRWISEPDKGIYDAMNKGIAMATGDVIGILNSDDFYRDSQVLSHVAKAFLKTNADSVYGDLAYVEARDTSKILRYWKSGQYKEGSFLHGWMPPHPTFFVRREVYNKYNGFDTRLKSAADYELMLRLIHKHKISVAYLPEVLVFMRAGGKSNQSLSNRLKANREDHLAWQLNNINPNLLTLILKPLRKVEQFLFNSYKTELTKQLNTYSTPIKVDYKAVSTSVN